MTRLKFSMRLLFGMCFWCAPVSVLIYVRHVRICLWLALCTCQASKQRRGSNSRWSICSVGVLWKACPFKWWYVCEIQQAILESAVVENKPPLKTLKWVVTFSQKGFTAVPLLSGVLLATDACFNVCLFYEHECEYYWMCFHHTLLNLAHHSFDIWKQNKSLSSFNFHLLISISFAARLSLVFLPLAAGASESIACACCCAQSNTFAMCYYSPWTNPHMHWRKRMNLRNKTCKLLCYLYEIHTGGWGSGIDCTCCCAQSSTFETFSYVSNCI